MNEINRVIRSASWRLWVIDLFRTLAVSLTVGLAGVLIARVVERTFGLSFSWMRPYGGIFAAVGAAVGFAAVVWSIVLWKKSAEVALELDERAGLREALSTALCVSKNSDPWSQAMVETARASAAGVKVREAIPMRPPRFWPAPLGAAAALAMLWFTLPSLDVLGIMKKKTEVQQQRQRLVEVKADIKAKDEKLAEMLAKAKVEMNSDELGSKGADKGLEVQKPEEIQRSAVKKLTDLADRLNAMKTGEKAEQAQALKDAMRQLKQPGDGPLNDFSRNLAAGKFDKADAALQELAQKLNDGAMSDAQKQQLKEQMKNLSDQLKKVSESNKDLEKKLAAAGMDPKKAAELAKELAKNPDALKKAIEQMKNLTPEQKEKLKQMAEAASKSAQQSESMSESMSKMSEGMDKQGMSQEGQEGMQQMGSELGQAEMMAQEMDSLSAALSETQAQLAELGGECSGENPGEMEGDPHLGDWQEGDSSLSRGNGSGGAGRGNYGGARPENAADFSINKEKAKVATGKGPIIGTRLVQGDQVKGDSLAEFGAATDAAEKAAAEAIDNQLVPRELQGSVKNYFGRLSEKSKGGAGSKSPAAPTKPPAAPASDAKDAPKK